MAPRGSSIGASSPIRAASHPIARRLDFEQEESLLLEASTLSGSGARRGKRAVRSSVYDIPEDVSPEPEESAVLEETAIEMEITGNDDSVVINPLEEESFAAQIGDDTTTGAEGIEDAEDSDIAPEPVKVPAKRGRKRKSELVETAEEVTSASKPRKRGAAQAQATQTQKPVKKKTAVHPRRSQRVSDIIEQEPSMLDTSLNPSIDSSEPVDEEPVVPKRRGRPPRVQPAVEKENDVSAKSTKSVATKAKGDDVFKKPSKPMGRPKANTGPKSKTDAQLKEKTAEKDSEDKGKLVNSYGNPLSKKDIEQMSTTSVGSRYGRGRHLSVFREMDPDAVARVGRTGRHRVAPIDFWKNESISYGTDGSMTAIVKNADPEPEQKRYKSHSTKGKKRALAAVEEEVDLEPWEEEDGFIVGNYKDFDPVREVILNTVQEGSKSRAVTATRYIN